MLSRDLAKRCACVVRIQTKWLTEPFFPEAINCEYSWILKRTTGIATVFQIVQFVSDYRYADPDTDTETRNIALKPTIDTL